MSDDIKGKVIDAIKMFQKNNGDDETISKPKAKRKTTLKTITQSAVGNDIYQAAGDININYKGVIKKSSKPVQAPAGTIGANSFLVERIVGMFNELGLRREERFGKQAYAVMYSEFKKQFSISRNQSYNIYLWWPEGRAQEIIDYLEEKLSNTINGKIQNAAKRKGHSARHLLGETSRLHKMLGWAEHDYRGHIRNLFGVTSRADLNQSQLANYVEYLRKKIDEQY